MNARSVRVAVSCVAIVDLAAYGLGCLDGWSSTNDALSVVASYAEPLRSLTMLAALCALYALSRRAEKLGSIGWFTGGAAVSFLLALELGKSVHFHPVAGTVEVRRALIALPRIQFRKSSEGVCVQADASSPWIWRLNQHTLWHLPLPKASERFESQVLIASRGQSLSDPDACREP